MTEFTAQHQQSSRSVLFRPTVKSIILSIILLGLITTATANVRRFKRPRTSNYGRNPKRLATLPASGLTQALDSLSLNCDKWIHRSKNINNKPIIINCCFTRKNAPCGTSTSAAYQVSCKRNLGLNKVQETSYQVCHDRSNDNTLYSVNTLLQHTQNTKSSASSLSDVQKRTTNKTMAWRTGPKGLFYTWDPKSKSIIYNSYKKVGQVKNLKKILNLTSVEDYIGGHPKRIFYLAKGHLSARADTDTSNNIVWATSTYYYINSAPQWQSFNQGNWGQLEAAVRKLLRRRQTQQKKNSLVIITGTYGTFTLPDLNNNQQEIHMIIDQNGKGHIPVPKYFWKIVWDKKVGRATAFIGINNPYLAKVDPDLIFCKDVCDQMPWFQDTTVYRNRHIVTKGYLFCCQVKNLVAKLNYSKDALLSNTELLNSGLLL